MRPGVRRYQNQYKYVFKGGSSERTSVAKAVLPAPLGPASRKTGGVDVAAALRYKKVCTKMGRSMAMRSVRMIAWGVGEKAAVSQLSSSCHAMALSKKKSPSVRKRDEKDFLVVVEYIEAMRLRCC